MLGGLLTLAAMSLFDALVGRSLATLRNLIFVVIGGATCVLMTGLPEVFWPELPQRLVMLLKITLVPLSGAIALNYLGNWLGGKREDVIVYRFTVWGARVLFFSSIALAVLALQTSSDELRRLLVAAAAINMTAVLLGTVATIRAAALGDTCLFHVRDDTVLAAFPVQHVAGFGSAPPRWTAMACGPRSPADTISPPIRPISAPRFP